MLKKWIIACPGRRVRELPLFVPRAFYALAPSWMDVGFELWAKIGDKNRDFFLPRPGPDLESFTQVPASAGDLAALGRLTLERLRIPIRRVDPPAGDHWQEGPEDLLAEGPAGGWTGHSERCTLPSAFAALGAS